MRRFLVRYGAVVVVALVLPACAAHRGARAAAGPPPQVTAPADTLADYIARVRALSARATPRPAFTAGTLESIDPNLSAALTEVRVNPSVAGHLRVATEYRRVGVLDRAYAHFSEAVRLDPRDAGGYEGRARIWRDWGFAGLGLGDAYRAVFFAPHSPAAANTLGTLLQALGHVEVARRWYERALLIDPAATYALNNTCYAAIMSGDRHAVQPCRLAAQATPASAVAQNNLALAYAAAGDFDSAETEFLRAGDQAQAAYNMGIAHMARREFSEALKWFGTAIRLRPTLADVAERARQARTAAAEKSRER